jgi:hypothetical protein
MDGGSDGGGQSDPADQRRGDGGQNDGRDGKDGNARDGGRGFDAGGQDDAQPSYGDGGVAQNVDRAEAERLLDSMKQTEKSLQLWRFQQKKKKGKANEKDW